MADEPCERGITERSIEHLMEDRTPTGIGLEQHGSIRGQRDIPPEKRKASKRRRMRAQNKHHAFAPERQVNTRDGCAGVGMELNRLAVRLRGMPNTAAFGIDAAKDRTSGRLARAMRQADQSGDELCPAP